jgi:hypothetical protein
MIFSDSIYTGLHDGRIIHIRDEKIVKEFRLKKVDSGVRCGMKKYLTSLLPKIQFEM